MPRLLSKFAVRAYLILFTFLLMFLGIWLLFVFPIIRQHMIADHLEANGANVKWETSGSRWVEKYLGSYWCTEVVSVKMNAIDNASELVSGLSGLRALQHLEIHGNGLTDDDLRPLAGLTQLTTLDIRDNAITDQGLIHLKGLYNLKTLLYGEPLGQQGVDVLAQLPSLEMEYLNVDQVTAQDLFKFPELPKIHTLGIRRPIGKDWAKVLAVCKELEELYLTDTPLTDQQLLTIVQANPLRKLYLENVPVGNSILPTLAEKRGLQRLQLNKTQVSYEKMMVQLGPLANSILLYDNNIVLLVHDKPARQLGWEGRLQIEKLAALRHCQKCTFIRVLEETYTEGDLSVLREMSELRGIQIEASLTDADLQVISEIPNLTAITLSSPQRVTPQGLAYLRNVRELIYLALFDTRLTDTHFREIGQFGSLQEIFLSDSKVTSVGISHLAGLQSLERLSFYDCESLDDSALQHIAKLSSLAELTFNNVPITDEGLTYLYGMPNLRYVSLHDTHCTADGEKEMDKHLPTYFQYYELSN